ncbi:MAG: Ig-like domain-containing protein [Patescibacteria group bacterium]
MSIWQRINYYFGDRRNYRRIVAGSLGLVLVVVIILFNQDLSQMWRWLRGQAEEGPSWTTDTRLITGGTAHGKTIEIDHPNGNRYLYVIGGAEYYTVGGEKRLRLLDTVQRIKLDSDGKIAPSVAWEAAPSLYTGHAEFATYYLNLSDKHWLYVISGDIHIPDIDDDEIDNPLLFSTIERLDLDNEANGWQPVALLTGLNFYPETVEFGGQFHIVGGVYGNIFGKYLPTSYSWYNDHYQVKDPLLPDDDKTKWNEKYKVLRTQDNGRRLIGPVGLTLKDGGIDDDILDGGTDVIQGPGQDDLNLGMDDGQVHIAAGNEPNIADQFSQALISGAFATTVSEHYSIKLDDFSSQHIGELGTNQNAGGYPESIETSGNDYYGKLITTWEEYGSSGGKVAHLGHLRIVVDLFYPAPTGTPYFYVYPAPQGRYGHKLVVTGTATDQRLYVLGGATWSTPIIRYNWAGEDYFFQTEAYTFWVLEDAIDPITNGILFPNDLYHYKFAGNRAYEWSPSNLIWKGTNLDSALNIETFDEDFFPAPDPGAFFSLAKLEPQPGVIDWLITGGLANENNKGFTDTWPGAEDPGKFWPALRTTYPAGGGLSKWGISVKVSDRSEHYSAGNTWQDSTSGDKLIPSFNASSSGIGGYAIVLGGQTTFQGSAEGSDAPYNNDYVPDISDVTTTQTRRFDLLTDGSGQWSKINSTDSDFHINKAFYDFGNVISSVGGVSGGKIIYLYKVGGAEPNQANPTLSRQVEWLGPFTYGRPGVVDPSQSTIVIKPLRDSYTEVDIDGVDTEVATVWNDHYDYGTATIFLKDYYGDPVTSVGDNIVTVSLYTSRSSAPAIDKYGSPDYYRDDIRIIGTPYSGSVPAGWQNQLVEVDGNGQATFRLLSGFATDADTGQPIFEEVRGYVYIDNASVGTGEKQEGVGWAPLIFTREGHPSALYSDLTADPHVVKADDIDTSLLEVTIKDYKNLPIPGFTVLLTSNRNYFDPDTSPDHFANPQLITDEKGQAQTIVTSDLRGSSIIYGYYTIPNYENPPDLPPYCKYKTTVVKFTLEGRILSLSPSSGKQGQGQTALSPLEAVGQDTLWTATETNDNYNTTVSFVAPSNRFSTPGQDINNLQLIADGISATQFVVDANTANEAVTIEIIEGGGCLVPSSDFGCAASKTVYANANKQATFTYQASDTTGILKIKATFSNNSTSMLWLPLVEANGYLEMVLIADPNYLKGTNSSSQISALPTNFGGFILASEINWDTYPPVTDDPTGTLTEVNRGTTDAFLVLNYNQADVKTIIHIFVIGVYNGKKIVGMVPIYHQKSAGDANNIIFNNHDANGQPNNLTVADLGNSQQKLTALDGIAIGLSAQVGVWTFCVNTLVSEPDPINGGNMDVLYTETAPFVVYPSDYGDQAIIVRLEPNQGLRGQQDLRVGIIGLGTNFVDYVGDAQSVVTFTPFKPENGGDTGGVTATVIPGIDPPTGYTKLEYLTVDIDITEKATMGYWNIQVVSGGVNNPDYNETAEGTKLFFVTTSTGYFVDLIAEPNPIVRSINNQSDLTATVGHINEFTGSIDYQNNKSVTFAIIDTVADSDYGEVDQGPYDTNGSGLANSTYTVNTGIVDDTDTIEAAAKISDTVTVYGTVVITKVGVGSTDPSGLTSTLEPQSSAVPTDPDGDGNPFVELTVTVRNGIGTPLANKSVVLTTDRGALKDKIWPSATQTTDVDGKAVYRVSSGQTGLSAVTATIENTIMLPGWIKFEAEGVLVARHFEVTVPFQAQDYDNKVLIIAKDNNWSSNGDLWFKKECTKNARNATSPDQPNYCPLLNSGGNNLLFYFYSDHTYTLWAKGKQHLAVANVNISSGTTPTDDAPIVVDFTTVNGGRGLLAGDIVTASGVSEVYPGYHDNVVSKLVPLADDLKLLVDSWFKITDIYLPDINFDGLVNSIDVLYGLTNLGNGAPKP